MSAVRLARAYTGRNKILKFEGCYHGHSDALLVKSGSGLLTDGYQDSNGITEGVLKDTLTVPFGDREKIKEVLAKNNIACLIMEPVPKYGSNLSRCKVFKICKRDLYSDSHSFNF